jgi:hypothetical protein
MCRQETSCRLGRLVIFERLRRLGRLCEQSRRGRLYRPDWLGGGSRHDWRSRCSNCARLECATALVGWADRAVKAALLFMNIFIDVYRVYKCLWYF